MFTLTLQAESARLVGPRIGRNQAGFTGSGFVDYLNPSNDYIEWTVEVPRAGAYDLSWRYAVAGGSASRPLELTVNGVQEVASLDFPSTESWDTWAFVHQSIALNAGINTIRLTAIGSSGGNFDYLEITEVAPPPLTPVVTLDLQPTGGSEADRTAIRITATASAAVSGNQTVDLEISGLGIDAADFSGPLPTQITVLDGQTTGSVLIPIADDAVAEGTETATVTLRNPSAGLELGTLTTSTFAIADNDEGTGGNSGETRVKYQAEQARLSGALVANKHQGAEGSYADFQNAAGDFIEWSIVAPIAGTYTLAFRYALDATNRPLELQINDTVAVASLGFANTGGWANWQMVTQSVTLQAGTNRIRLTAIGNSGANIDYLEVIGTAPTVPTVALTLSANTASESDRNSITLTATASQAVSGDQTVDVTIAGLGITAADFNGPLPTQITIPDGGTTGSVTLTIADDEVAEGAETALITLRNPSAGIGLGTPATGTLTLVDNDGGSPPGSLPISLLPYSEIRVEGTVVFEFDGSDGGLVDKDGEAIGFTMVDPTSNPSQPNSPSGVVGYRPEFLDVDPTTGVLALTTTSGIQFQTTNSLDNALGVGLNLPSQSLRLQTTLVDLPIAPGGYAQAGLWFGQAEGGGAGSSEDHYIKLVVIATQTGDYKLQALMEQDGLVLQQQQIDIPDDPDSLTLNLFVNPSTKTVAAQYSLAGGATQQLTTFTNVPQEWFSFDQAGIDPTLGTRSFGGIFATDRLAETTTFRFEDFSVTEVASPDPPIAGETPFDRWSIPVNNATAMAFGPDNRLYVATLFGTIYAFTIDFRTRTVSSETINTIRTAEGDNRLTLGLTIDPDSTPDNVILWVGHSNGSVSNGALNSSKISRLSGPGFSQKEDVVVGLPRAIANHALNNLDFGPNGKLYAWVGGNTGAGAANAAPTEFGDRPEQVLSAAVLEIDIPRWKADPDTFDGNVASPIGEFIDEFYARKAQELGRPYDDVKVFASGLRNTYDGVFHSNGNLYAPNNGLGVTGTVPPVPRLGDASDRNIATLLGEIPIDNPGAQSDSLNLIVENGYYGHPNPYRDEVVFKDGSFQGFNASNFPANHPLYRLPLFDLGNNRSANGIIEYTADNFFGELQGDLLLANFSQGDNVTRIELAADGQSVVNSTSLIGGFTDPLPLAMGPNGTIFVGEFNGGQVTVLDPLGAWRSDLPQMPTALVNPGSAVWEDTLFLVGGTTASGPVNSLYRYDPGDPLTSGDDIWLAGPNRPGVAVENLAVAAVAGKIYTFGGSTEPSAGAVDDAVVFDPLTSTWSALADMPTARSGATAQVLNGKIYVIGGLDPTGASVNAVEIFDPLTGLWSTGTPMSTVRYQPGAAVIDDRLYVFGGQQRGASGTGDEPLTSLEIYDPIADSWSLGAPMLTGRYRMGVGLINDRIQAIGGESDSALPLNEEYDPLTNQWRTLPTLPTARAGVGVGTIADVIYVAGGSTAGATFTAAVEAFTF